MIARFRLRFRIDALLHFLSSSAFSGRSARSTRSGHPPCCSATACTFTMVTACLPVFDGAIISVFSSQYLNFVCFWIAYSQVFRSPLALLYAQAQCMTDTIAYLIAHRKSRQDRLPIRDAGPVRKPFFSRSLLCGRAVVAPCGAEHEASGEPTHTIPEGSNIWTGWDVLRGSGRRARGGPHGSTTEPANFCEGQGSAGSCSGEIKRRER